MNSIKDIWSDFQFPREFLAVEWHIGEDTWSWVHLKLQKNQVELLNSRSTSAIDSFFKDEKNLPCLLIITGRKVLTKKVQAAQAGNDQEELLHRAFPNVNPEDLVSQVALINETEYAVSAIRKSFVNDLVKKWPTDFPLIDLAISAYSLWPVISQLEDGEVNLGNFQVNVAKGEITPKDRETGDPVDLFGEKISPEYAVAFLFGILKSSTKTFHTENKSIATYREDWKYSRFYKKGMLASAVAIFVILLTSFMGFSYYSEKTAEVSSLTQSYDQQIAQLNELKETYKKKEQFLKANGGQVSNTARMAEEVARLVPEKITLEQMSFHPVEKRLKRENLVRFYRNELIIKGETRAYSHFRNWLGDLKGLSWTGSIEIIGYEEASNGHEAGFTIRIRLDL